MAVRLRPAAAILAIIVICATALAAWEITWRAGLADMRQRAMDQLALRSEALEAVIERYRYLPFMLAQDSLIRRIVSEKPGPALIDEANSYLERVTKAAKASVLYVMDSTGLTIASSNHAEPTSFVGHSYGFRPYFQDAIAKGNGQFFAIGVTTSQPGYFLSHAIQDNGKPLGVAVVKVDLHPLEASWRAAGESVAILDRSGIAFLTSEDEWRYRPLKPLNSETQQRLDASRQYKNIDLSDVSLIDSDASFIGGELISIQSRDRQKRAPQVLVHRLPLPAHGWTLIAASDVTPLRERANLVAAVTALALALIGLIGLFLQQRRQLLRAKLESHAILERRVDERTRKLRDLNEELAHEIEVRQQAEDELRRTQGELIQAAKLAALGQMSAAIVHEVSQPITAIETYLASTRLLLERGATEAVSANLATVSDLIGRMRRMAKSLKSFARKEEGHSEIIDLHTILLSAIELVRPRLEIENIALAIDNRAEDRRVRMNSIRAEQIIVNLLNNAFDAMKDVEQRKVQICLDNDGGWAVLSIADNGVGIPCHLRDRVREPFFTSKKAGEGLGLGLFICEAITGDAGGNLSFDDAEGGGTVFLVRLPLCRQPISQAAE